MIKSCLFCGSMSHTRVECPHGDQILEIHRMAGLADYYVELVFPNPNDKNKLNVTWRHNRHNPKNFCNGEEFLQMCRERIEWRKQTGNN